ncbi:hypothetical protein D3C79_746500 [compost metagenome]
MVDLALAAVLCVHRHHRHAVGLAAAIATAFTYRFVDHHSTCRVGELTALATPALLRCAGLVIDDCRHSLELAQLLLDLVHLVAAYYRYTLGQIRNAFVLLDIVTDHHQALNAFCSQLAADLCHAQVAVHRLPACHGHGIVVENFVGDLRLCRDGGTNGENAGVEVGTVTQVGKDMLGGGKGRLADPGYSFATHLAEGLGLRVDPGGHVVAADTGQRAATFRHLGRGIVRTARAVVRHALHQVAELAFAGQLCLQ